MKNVIRFYSTFIPNAFYNYTILPFFIYIFVSNKWQHRNKRIKLYYIRDSCNIDNLIILFEIYFFFL